MFQLAQRPRDARDGIADKPEHRLEAVARTGVRDGNFREQLFAVGDGGAREADRRIGEGCVAEAVAEFVERRGVDVLINAVAAGANRVFRFEVDPSRDLSFPDADGRRILEPGEIILMAGDQSASFQVVPEKGTANGRQ